MSVTGAGLLKSKSDPDADFGKAITSRMDDVLHKIAIIRSYPVEKERKNGPELFRKKGSETTKALQGDGKYTYPMRFLHEAGHRIGGREVID